MASPHYWTYAEIAEHFGVSRRTVSNWIREHKIPVTTGRPARVAPDDLAALATILGRPFPSLPVVSPAFGKPEETHGKPRETTGNVREATGKAEEPLEAAYRVTPGEIAQAVSRTSAQYMGDLRTMLAEVGKVYEGQLAAKDAALAAQAETIAELRRRAEAAEAERDRLTAAQAAPAPLGAPEPPAPGVLVLEERVGILAQLRRLFGGKSK